MKKFTDFFREAEANEVASMATRMKMKASMRKNKAKIALGRKKAAKKLASPEQLKQRAIKQAKNFLIKKMLKDKSKGDLGMSGRKELEKKLAKKKGAIAKIAKKMLPMVKAKDRAKLKKNKGE